MVFSLKPKIVSVKALQAKKLPPPSEEEYVFLEAHGEVGSEPQKQKIVVEKKVEERKGFFGWLKGIFGK